MVLLKQHLGWIILEFRNYKARLSVKGQTTKLRNMSAHVTEEKNIAIELASGEVLNLENALVLHSYDSRVAVYCKMRVYLLPRYDYSVTTWKHVHAFIQDYCSFVWDCNAREMRKIAALGVEREYAFAKGIVEGVPVENVNCEGCALFGNVECSRLCALTHRVVTW